MNYGFNNRSRRKVGSRVQYNKGYERRTSGEEDITEETEETYLLQRGMERIRLIQKQDNARTQEPPTIDHAPKEQ